jgi:hypothetical protein
MSNKDGFIDSLKHMVFEDEPESAKATPTPAPAANLPKHVATNPAAPVFNHESYSPPEVSDNDEIYQRVLAKTAFEQTEVGSTIHKFLDPLDGLPMDAALKFKTAVAQAKAQNGLNEGAILATFDSLKAALDAEQQSFTKKAQQFAAKEITGRQDRINEITSQITTLQQELSQLSTQLVDAQGKAARAHGQFNAAIERRAAEIEQQKLQFSALLK